MLDRSIAPALTPLKNITLPAPKRYLCHNGAEIFYFQNSDLKTITFEIQIHASRRHEAIHGQAQLLASMLKEGTSKLSSADLAARIAALGAQISVYTEPDYFLIYVRCLAVHFDKILDIIYLIFKDSQVPEKELAQHKRRTISHINLELQKNSVWASRYLLKNLYGEEHPYGRSLWPEDIEKITRQDLLDFKETYLLKAPWQLFLSGDVTDTHIQKIDKLFGRHRIKKGKSSLPKAPVMKKSPLFYEEKQNKVQSTVMLGKTFSPLTILSANHTAFLLLNDLLGGYFGSRLSKNLREKKGLTYGVHSSLTVLRSSERWVITSDVRKESLHEALAAIEEEMNTLRKRPPTEQELNNIKNYRKGVFLSSFKTFENFATRFRFIYNNALPENYYTDYFERLDAVTPAQIQALAKKHLKNFVKIAVG